MQNTRRRARRSRVVVASAAVWRVGRVRRQAGLTRTPTAHDHPSGVNVCDIGGTGGVEVDGAGGGTTGAGGRGDGHGDIEAVDEGD